MHKHGRAQILLIERFRAIGQHDDREFQPLGFMDGQDAHRAAARPGVDGLPVLPTPGHAAQQRRKPEQAPAATLLKGARPLEEGKQVRLPLAAVRQRAI